MNITPIFGIPIYSKQIENVDNRISKENSWTAINNGLRTDTNKYLNDNEYYSNIMKQCVNEYLYEVLLLGRHQSWRWTTSWGLKHDPGHYSISHIHTNAMFSCILYTAVPKNSGDLLITKDSRNIWTTDTITPDVERYTSLTTPEIRIRVDNGYCVIFPGFVYHGSTKNESESSRYCVVGNIFISGTMGHDIDTTASPLSELTI